MRLVYLFIISVCVTFAPRAHAFITELGPLLQLVTGQVQEIERLSESVGFARDQVRVLVEMNRGIEGTVQQIQSIQEIVDRAQGLDPTAVKSIADLNEQISKLQDLKRRTDEVLAMKLKLTDHAINQSGEQSETAYKMGQEMISTGAGLAQESQTASPGRAAQITAAASSAQMLSQGVELQTLAQIAQLQAMLLDLHKSKAEQELIERRNRDRFYQSQLASVGPRVSRRRLP